jgi:Holliday junction resolvase RusA-like endonuclease
MVIKKIIKAAYGPEKIMEGAVSLSFVFRVSIPKSTPAKIKAKMISGETLPTKRPDATNYQKLYEDTLKGIVIVDDSQVVDINSSKRYNENPETIITVQEVMCH